MHFLQALKSKLVTTDSLCYVNGLGVYKVEDHQLGKGLSPFKKFLATHCIYVTAKHHQHLLHANVRKMKLAATVAIVGVLASDNRCSFNSTLN